MNYHIATFGCQMNEHDSEIISGVLEGVGFKSVSEPEATDLFIFNTCAVRESAENKILGRLGALKKYKDKNPACIIAVCGCMIQQGAAAERILKRAPFVDIIFSTHNVAQLPSLIEQVRQGVSPVLAVTEPEQVEGSLPVRREGKVKAYVTIMYGCNNFCSYCIVPYVRGRERSREPEAILSEIKQLAGEGYKEVMLLGQNVNSYGKSLGYDYDFPDLLQAVEAIDGIERIRFMTSHPKDFSDKLITVIASSKKITEQIHLPIQAGSNKILKAMNRGYTKEEYFTLVDKIRAAIPNAALSTDIIVGFPGETEEDFEETLAAVRKVRFDAAYTFIYSKRTGTQAAKLEEQVPLNERKSRIKRLMALQTDIGYELNQKMIGNSYPVLVEGVSKTNAKMLSGRTTSGKNILFEGSEALVGKIVQVKVTNAQTWNIFGKIIND